MASYYYIDSVYCRLHYECNFWVVYYGKLHNQWQTYRTDEWLLDARDNRMEYDAISFTNSHNTNKHMKHVRVGNVLFLILEQLRTHKSAIHWEIT